MNTVPPGIELSSLPFESNLIRDGGIDFESVTILTFIGLLEAKFTTDVNNTMKCSFV